MLSGALVNDDREMDLVPSSAFFFFFFICFRVRFCLRMQFVGGETCPGFVHPFNITYIRFLQPLEDPLSYPFLVPWLGD